MCVWGGREEWEVYSPCAKVERVGWVGYMQEYNVCVVSRNHGCEVGVVACLLTTILF